MLDLPWNLLRLLLSALVAVVSFAAVGTMLALPDLAAHAGAHAAADIIDAVP